MKQPIFFHRDDDSLFAFAGLWEFHPEFGESCTIVTTTANEVVQPTHARMPVILQPSDWRIWTELSSSKSQIESLLRPAPDDFLIATPVRSLVNNPRNESPRCTDSLSMQDQLQLRFSDD
jgi:putative SOS response-associated peptidase YedK